MNLYPFLKFGINVINDNGVLKIVDERKDQLRLPPIDIEKDLFNVVALFDGKRTVSQIWNNLSATMGEDPMPILENLFDVLSDRVELRRTDSMVRTIKCREGKSFWYTARCKTVI